MRIAVIGAGAAGLAAVRHCRVEPDVSFICYEKTNVVGGTWVYVPETGKDAYGLPIHTSMYDSLRTNLPKEVMGYPDYQIPENPKSYIKRTEILDFLNSYCDHFKLRDKIHFQHHVEEVEPSSEPDKGKWRVRVRDLAKGTLLEERFDAVMVCNGHYFQPSEPELKGREKFRGWQVHSHDYRVSEPFAGKRVVVIGAGPSGMDLALEISKKAERVILSHHMKEKILTKFPDNIVQKPDVVELKEHSAVFKDGSEEIRFVLKFWLKKLELPSGESMRIDEDKEKENRFKTRGFSKHQFHMMGPLQKDYYDDLADTAKLERLPPVLSYLHNESSKRFNDDLIHYRDDRYKIIDNDNYVQLH